ncbi:AsmA-like C-terminal region-containing protein [Stieleria varia]|uniref:AsmA-like C-terminal region-containing protein n=1 Tax=Stieleria varia TaxID=2528005 RepID=UPI0011B3EA3D|nr:AsmA-like C-terminal region-containing protein [Stieleria varia]
MLVIAGCLFIIWTIAPQTVGEQARRHLEKTFREHYPNLQVSIERGRYDPKIGLIFDNISISEPASSSGLVQAGLEMLTGPSEQMVHIKRLVVVADTQPQRLLERGNPLVTRRLVIEGVEAEGRLRADGTISLQSLWPLPKFGPKACPRIEVRDVDFTLISDQSTGKPIKMNFAEIVTTENPLAGSMDAQGNVVEVQKVVTARGSSSFVDEFAINANIVPGGADVEASIGGLRWSDDLFDRLPEPYREKIQQARGLTAVSDTRISARYRVDAPIAFKTRTKIRDGRLEHPALPLPLDRLGGVVTCTRDGVDIESFYGMWGDANYHVTGRMEGLQWPAKVQLNCGINHLLLDQRVASVLPEKLRAHWDKFQPYGRVDARIPQLKFENGKWSANATVTCKGVDVRYEKFPYPVQQLVGDIELTPTIVSSELMVGRVGGQGMQCAFVVPTRPELPIEKRITIQTDGPIAIDNVMLDSLSPRGKATSKLESFMRSLNPRGAIHLQTAILGNDKSGDEYRDIKLQVFDGTIRFDKFAYPIYNVTGNVQLRNDDVYIQEFHGVNASGGRIACNGIYRLPPKPLYPNTPSPNTPSPNTPSPNTPSVATLPAMELDFHATDVPMDGALRASLPEASQMTWDALSPSGVLDELFVKLTQQHPDPVTGEIAPLEMDVAAREHITESPSQPALRLQPVALPYRLDITDGLVRFDGEKVTIDSLRAQHDATRLSAEGFCGKRPDGRWRLVLDVHSGSRLNPDAELIEALPIEMRQAMRELQLRGPVGVRGRTETLLSDENNPNPVFDWNLVLQLEGNRIGDVGPVHSLRGELFVRGKKDESGIRANGDVQIDSMHVDDLQITGIRGPYSVVDDLLQLGSVTDQAIPLQGNLFGGHASVQGSVLLSDASFDVQMALQDAQVPSILAEIGEGRSELTGTLNGRMTLEGLLGTTELLSGNGAVTVENANLYQLPFLVQLLNLFSITATEDVAFTNGDVKFTLSESELIFNDLKMWGSLIALQGSGTLDRRRELDLTFNTRVSPRNGFSQLLSPLKSQRYTLWTVDVRGPLEDPMIERRALDGVGQTLERLFPGMGSSAQRPPPPSGIDRR